MSTPWDAWLSVWFPRGGDAPAPSSGLVQPILPGWIFANTVSVTEANSRAPETERQIVERASYGRQLGRMMDALAVLVRAAEQQGLTLSKQDKAAFADFETLRDQILEIRTRTARERLSESAMNQLATDLEGLKKSDPEKYDHLSAILRKALKV